MKYLIVTIPVIFYRYAKHYMEDNVPKRTLLKVFGIRFDIIVKSLVGKIFFFLDMNCSLRIHQSELFITEAVSF